MNEAAAREVVLLQAFETTDPASPNWSDEDRAWATRLALQHDAAKGGAKGDAEAFVVRRAQHAMQRLAPREGAAALWLGSGVWRARWIAWAALAGSVLGLFADSIGSSQRINLLAPPLWGVLLWNLVVYALLIGHALRRRWAQNTRSGGLVRLAERVLRVGRSPPAPGAARPASSSAPAWKTFANLWPRCSAPLSAARAATLLHAAAAGLAPG